MAHGPAPKKPKIIVKRKGKKKGQKQRHKQVSRKQHKDQVNLLSKYLARGDLGNLNLGS